MEWADFGFALLGGVLIGFSAVLLLWFNGRIAGISGILSGLVRPTAGDLSWRVAFAGGLLAGGLALRLFMPSALPTTHEAHWLVVLVAGFLVGFGARVGSGCTSGHGVCGIGRLSLRSIVATTTFILTGAITVFVAGLTGVHP
ncbi:MAG: YeeE/YedE family protein [Myxococcales bacterium]|nr:YeeE/YedE family protein [Myxococcales bacterium]MCB9649964.1 YeeE/YedE family protein [Deltaproteobacteria bacterium]